MKKQIFLVMVLFTLLVVGLVSSIELNPKENLKEIKNKTYKNTFVNAKFETGDVKLEFLADIATDDSVQQLFNKISFRKNKVTITEQDLNKPAKITFYNTGLKNPIVLHNKKWNMLNTPTRIGTDTYQITVYGFSTWELVDNTWQGTHDNTTTNGTTLEIEPDAVFISDFEGINYTLTNFLETSDYEETISFIQQKWDTNSIIGNSLRFYDTGTYLETPTLNLGNNFTIMGWVEVDLYNYGDVMSTSTPNTLTFITYADGHTSTDIGDGGWCPNNILTPAGTLKDETWVMFTLTYNSTHIEFYLNKTRYGVGDCSGYTMNRSFVFGKRAPTSYYLDGFLDELKFFNKTLTYTEINYTYDNESTGQRINLSPIAEYRLDEDNDNFLIDSSPYNNDGTLYDWYRPDVGLGVFGSDSLSFSGVNDYVSFLSTNLQFSTDINFTVSYWILPTPSAAVQRIMGNSDTSPLGGWSQDLTSLKPRFFGRTGNAQEYLITCDNALTSDVWTHVTMTANRTGDVAFYFNNTLQPATLGPTNNASGLVNNYNTTDIFTIGRIPTDGNNNYQGILDDLMIFPKILGYQERQNILEGIFEPQHMVFEKTATYTSQIFNSSDYDNETELNIWGFMIFDDNSYLDMVSGKAGDCSNMDAETWVGAIPNGLNYSFTSLEGECFQYELQFLSQGNDTPEYNNITIYNFKVNIPVAFNATIGPTFIYSNTTIIGNATFLLNDTDEGVLQFDWYINGVLDYSENLTGLINNTRVQSNYTDGFSKNNEIYFTATPITVTDYGDAWGVPIQSSNVTVLNSNYSYTYTPLNLTVDILKPRQRNFNIIIIEDIDNDVVVTWYVDNVAVDTGTAYTLSPLLYDDYALFTLSANLTDGEINNSVGWSITILPPEVQMSGSTAIALFILFGTALFFIMPNIIKFSDNEISTVIIKRCCYIIGIYLMVLNSSVIATIASYSGIEVTNEIFRYLWIFGTVGYLFMAGVFIQTLWSVINLYNTKKNKDRFG